MWPDRQKVVGRFGNSRTLSGIRSRVRTMKSWGKRAISSTVVAAVLAGCGILGPDIDTTGVVHFRDLEGGCWVIETNDRVFSPTNLPGELKVDGLEVRFEADFRRTLAGFCPGEIVELKKIERA